MEIELERALDQYEAHLTKALSEHYGVSAPEQRSEAARKAVMARWARAKKRKK